jgi:hypothetical protein
LPLAACTHVRPARHAPRRRMALPRPIRAWGLAKPRQPAAPWPGHAPTPCVRQAPTVPRAGPPSRHLRTAHACLTTWHHHGQDPPPRKPIPTPLPRPPRQARALPLKIRAAAVGSIFSLPPTFDHPAPWLASGAGQARPAAGPHLPTPFFQSHCTFLRRRLGMAAADGTEPCRCNHPARPPPVQPSPIIGQG